MKNPNYGMMSKTAMVCQCLKTPDDSLPDLQGQSLQLVKWVHGFHIYSISIRPLILVVLYIKVILYKLIGNVCTDSMAQNIAASAQAISANSKIAM